MNNLNLATDKWIPVVDVNNQEGLASLIEIFSNGINIMDINADSLERIALMRLFICVAQAALDGPKDANELKNAAKLLPDIAPKYLQKWAYKFNLFDDKYPFLQAADVKDYKIKPASTLNFYSANGSNKVFLNNKPDSDEMTLEQLALKLLVYQNFVPCGPSGALKFGGIWTSKTHQGYSVNSLCTAQNALHTFVLKSNILDSIIANIIDKSRFDKGYGIDKQEFGAPYWHFELNNQNSPIEAVENNTKSFLGRLVPLCRTVKLFNKSEMTIGDGLKYKTFPDYHEFSCTFFAGKKGEDILRANESKAVWRSLHSIIAKQGSVNANRPPAALANGVKGAYILWVGAILTKNNEKILNTIESSFKIPEIGSEDIGFDNAIKSYAQSVYDAELREKQIDKAVKIYRDALHLQTEISLNVKRIYWNLLSNKQSILMQLFDENIPEENVKNEWKAAYIKAAIEAFSNVCSRQTPRQIAAFARAKIELYKSKK